MTKYPLTYEEFKAIYSKVPRLTVELVVKTPEGILLTKRAVEPYIGLWHIPGGTVYYGETLPEAVSRVAHDELGVKVTTKRFIDFIYYPDMVKTIGWDTPIGAAFLVEITDGEVKTNEQGDEWKSFAVVPEMVPSQDEFLLRHKFLKAK